MEDYKCPFYNPKLNDDESSTPSYRCETCDKFVLHIPSGEFACRKGLNWDWNLENRLKVVDEMFDDLVKCNQIAIMIYVGSPTDYQEFAMEIMKLTSKYTKKLINMIPEG